MLTVRRCSHLESQRNTSAHAAGRTSNSRLIARIQSSRGGYTLQLPFGPSGPLLSARHPEHVKPSDQTEPTYYLNKCPTVGTTYVISLLPIVGDLHSATRHTKTVLTLPHELPSPAYDTLSQRTRHHSTSQLRVAPRQQQHQCCDHGHGKLCNTMRSTALVLLTHNQHCCNSLIPTKHSGSRDTSLLRTPTF